jgi:low affinity Fe/Cu permease
MTTVEEIKTAITHLSEEELRELRAWYEQRDAQQWDDQLEAEAREALNCGNSAVDRTPEWDDQLEVVVVWGI